MSVLRNSRKRLIAASGVIMAALAVAGTSVPAHADAGPGGFTSPASAAVRPQTVSPADQIVYETTDLLGYRDSATGRCLDSNAAGDVYTSGCQVPGNYYQDWYATVWLDYTNNQYYVSFQDRQTGRCLDSNASGDLYTSPCQAPGNYYQMWISGSNGTFKDRATGLYLDSNPGGSAYTHSYGGSADTYQDWEGINA